MNSREILIWLNNLRGINSRYLERLDNEFQDLTEIWHMSPEDIHRIDGIGVKLKESIIHNRNRSFYSGILERALESGVDIVTIRDDSYPQRLKQIPDAPRVLYFKGDIVSEDKHSIAIVGPRKASSYGIWATEKLTRDLSRLGITIVSGMALGVDATAHMTSLNEGNRTIAVLGTGVDVVYPRRNRHIYEKIIKGGAVISEFPIGTEGLPYRFPQRNRIISGISMGTVIIEAGEKSGTLTTAQHGLDQGREVFAVPGNINSVYSRGTNALIQDGAKLVQTVDDILCEISELKHHMERKREKSIDEKSLSQLERSIVDILCQEPRHAEKIAYILNQSVMKVISTLTVLEVKGMVKKSKGNLFMLV